MRKSQDVIGLPVLTIDTGKQIGVVRDLLFDREQRVFGLLVENEGWVKRARYIPRTHVTSIGCDAVTVQSESVLESLEDDDGIYGMCSGKRRLKGLPVVTATGRELGRLENVYFMEEVGTLIGYELTEGLLHDWREGRKALKTSKPLIWGNDALIVPGNASPEVKPATVRK